MSSGTLGRHLMVMMVMEQCLMTYTSWPCVDEGLEDSEDGLALCVSFLVYRLECTLVIASKYWRRKCSFQSSLFSPRCLIISKHSLWYFWWRVSLLTWDSLQGNKRLLKKVVVHCGSQKKNEYCAAALWINTVSQEKHFSLNQNNLVSNEGVLSSVLRGNWPLLVNKGFENGAPSHHVHPVSRGVSAPRAPPQGGRLTGSVERSMGGVESRHGCGAASLCFFKLRWK